MRQVANVSGQKPKTPNSEISKYSAVAFTKPIEIKEKTADDDDDYYEDDFEDAFEKSEKSKDEEDRKETEESKQQARA